MGMEVNYPAISLDLITRGSRRFSIKSLEIIFLGFLVVLL